MHLDSLKAVADDVYGRAQKREEEDNVRATSDGSTTDSALANSTNVGDLRDEDFAPARKWFEDRKAAQVIFTPTEKAWNGWSEELDGVCSLHLAPVFSPFLIPSIMCSYILPRTPRLPTFLISFEYSDFPL